MSILNLFPLHHLNPGTQVIIRTWDGGERADVILAYHANIKRGRAGYDLESTHWAYADQVRLASRRDGT